MLGSDQQFFIDRGRRLHSRADIEQAIFAELGHRLAGFRVQRDQAIANRADDPGRRLRVAWPIGHAAFGCLRGVVFPDLRAGDRIHGEVAIAGRDIHHAIDDDGRHLVLRGSGAGMKGPGARQILNVGRIDLR